MVGGEEYEALVSGGGVGMQSKQRFPLVVSVSHLDLPHNFLLFTVWNSE